MLPVRFLAVPLAFFALAPFQSSIAPLSPALRSEIRARAWHPACPVPLTGLRVLTVTYYGFDHRGHRGQLVVNARYAGGLAKVFRQLYAMRFPIRHMTLAMYGPPGRLPADNDLTGSFECRQAVPSPCTGGTGTGTWSMHAYGEAVDLNPSENPYVGCGMSRDKAARSYMDRSRLRPGMVTPAVVRAFASIGWGWGGAWSGSTRDYMHFSATGH
jgi:D-alanyl-D-alanine carboxypeptidase